MAVVKPITSFYFQAYSKTHYSTPTLGLLCLVAEVKIFFCMYCSLTELDSGFWVSDVPDVSKALLYVQTQLPHHRKNKKKLDVLVSAETY